MQMKIRACRKQALAVIMLAGIVAHAAPVPASSQKGSEVTVRPLSTGPRPTEGQISRTRIAHQERLPLEGELADNALRLAISENLPRGAGQVLRASSWVAAMSAARNVGQPLFGHTFTIEVQGMVDGPSAGALYAIGMLATLRGDKLLQDVTMTGALMPGGGIGMVGGIPQKINAAAKGGMRKVVLPESQRIDFGPGGVVVDIEDVAQKAGIELAFVSNLEEAYYELTGVLLRGPSSALRGEITLPPELMQIIRATSRQRYEQVVNALAEYDENPSLDILRVRSYVEQVAVLSVLEQLLAEISTQIMRGSVLMREGEWVAAYDVLAGALLNTAALQMWRDAKYIILADHQIDEILDRNVSARVEQRAALADATQRHPVDAALLNTRMMRDIFDMSAPLKVIIPWDLMMNKVEQMGEIRKTNFLKVPIDDPEEGFLYGNPEQKELYQDAQHHQAVKTLLAYRYRASAAITERADITTALVHPDFMASSLVFRDTRPTVRPLNAQRAKEWALFAESSFRAVADALGAAIEEYDEESQFVLTFDPLFQRAIALLNFVDADDEEAQGTEEVADDPGATQDLTAKDWFERAAFVTQEEVEIFSYLIRLELSHHDGTGEQNPLLRTSALRRVLDRASENARQAVLKARLAGYMVLGPSYDYLLAQGLRTGKVEDQFKALRLYWQTAAICNLVDWCTQP